MYRIIINKLDDNKPAIAAIGNFDGLHKGHLELIKEMNQQARLHNYKRLVIVFEPLPLEYFFDQLNRPRLTRLSLLRDKFLILKKIDYADELIVLRFNKKTANLSPKQFIENILKFQLNVTEVVVGDDFKFGKNGLGRSQDFKDANVKPITINKYLINNQRVSSSIIREYAKINDLSRVGKYLGRNLQYTSRVIYGNQLGRKYGVPTINLCLGHNVPALWGIYIAFVYIDGIRYNAVASIGKNPTVTNQEKYKLEAHLLDIDMDLYGKIATVEILEFMREEKKFADFNTMFEQIYADLELGRNYFKNIK